MGLIDDLDKRRERAAQDGENSARLAQSYAVFKTVGLGTSQYEPRVPFGLTFTEKPVVAYGSECDVEELADLLPIGEGATGAEDADDVVLPQCTGFVVDWDQDERGFYTGCWVGAVVSFPPSNRYPYPDELNEVQVEVGHHFTFSAIGMKDIPPDQSDQVD